MAAMTYMMVNRDAWDWVSEILEAVGGLTRYPSDMPISLSASCLST
jgi:hypothetical protein